MVFHGLKNVILDEILQWYPTPIVDDILLLSILDTFCYDVRIAIDNHQ